MERSSLVRQPLTGFSALAFYPPALFPETLRWKGTHCYSTGRRTGAEGLLATRTPFLFAGALMVPGVIDSQQMLQ